MSTLADQAHDIFVRALHADPQAVVDRYPDNAMAFGCLISRKIMRCDWRDLDAHIEHLRYVVREKDAFTEPVFNLIGTSQEEQYVNIKRYVKWRYPTLDEVKRSAPPKNRKKFRIGYLSADFHEHATCYLLASLFEWHDKNRFEIYAYSCGIDDHSPMRARIERSVERFIDLRALSIDDARSRIKEAELDILVDLKGWTTGNCMDIVAGRPAPIIVHYLGYPSTTGGMCDYIIGDRIIIPEYNRQWFSEKVVWLPGCYQINDDKCEIGETLPRAAYGLPPSGRIYANFNQQYKVTAYTWALWMEILRLNPGSVLWQYVQGEEGHENLQAHAKAAGIDPARIIKAHHIARPDHLARLRHVDVCLDTSPVSGHTTSSDALRMGRFPYSFLGRSYPKTFIGRVNASLATNLDTLWDAESKTRQIERAYEIMVEKARAGGEPEHIEL